MANRAALLLTLLTASNAQDDCSIVYKQSDTSCTRLEANKVILHGSPCHGGAEATLQILGYNQFPANETLTTGDYQYRVYEQGIRHSVASGADNIMKHITLYNCHFNRRCFSLAIPFSMPPKNSTNSSGQFTVSFLSKDQDHIYDLCLEGQFNYTNNTASAPTALTAPAASPPASATHVTTVPPQRPHDA